MNLTVIRTTVISVIGTFRLADARVCAPDRGHHLPGTIFWADVTLRTAQPKVIIAIRSTVAATVAITVVMGNIAEQLRYLRGPVIAEDFSQSAEDWFALVSVAGTAKFGQTLKHYVIKHQLSKYRSCGYLLESEVAGF